MTESRWIWLWWLGQWYLIEPWYREFYLPLWPGYMRGRRYVDNPKVVLTFGGKCETMRESGDDRANRFDSIEGTRPALCYNHFVS